MAELIVSRETHGAPSEFQLLPYGKIEVEGEGPAFLDNATMDQIIAHFNRRGNDMVIDYEHQTLKDIQAPAAGWIERLVNRGEQGLWAVVKWTEKAKQYLKNREYRYFSPVFFLRKSDRKVMQIVNAALTNLPKINELKPIVSKLGQDVPDLDETTLQIASQFNLVEEDFRKYAALLSDHVPDGTDEQSLLKVAKLMGNTEEDIEIYGDRNSGTQLNESDEAKIARLLGID